MFDISFCTTAVARPDIVERTYYSFFKRLQGISTKDCTLYINIDPLPPDVDRQQVVDVAQKYFKTVVPNLPDTPNFTNAYNFCWSAPDTEYLFNLEDDWELLEDIHVTKLIKKYFLKNPRLYEVALRAYTYKYRKLVMSPCIYHRRFYKEMGGKLDPSINPETQLRPDAWAGRKMPVDLPTGLHKTDRVVVYPKHVVVKDLGRPWMKKSKFARPPKKCYFTSWVRK